MLFDLSLSVSVCLSLPLPPSYYKYMYMFIYTCQYHPEAYLSYMMLHSYTNVPKRYKGGCIGPMIGLIMDWHCMRSDSEVFGVWQSLSAYSSWCGVPWSWRTIPAERSASSAYLDLHCDKLQVTSYKKRPRMQGNK